MYRIFDHIFNILKFGFSQEQFRLILMKIESIQFITWWILCMFYEFRKLTKLKFCENRFCWNFYFRAIRLNVYFMDFLIIHRQTNSSTLWICSDLPNNYEDWIKSPGKIFSFAVFDDSFEPKNFRIQPKNVL